MQTGVIGLGAMGAGIAKHLHRAGYLVAGWNRSRGRGEAAAAAHGFPLSSRLEELIPQCDLLISSVSADPDLLEVTTRLLPSLRPGAVLVDTSTVSADTARQAATLLAENGVGFLDAPVSGGREGAERGTLAMMVGGDAAVLERVRAVLESFTRSILYMGPTGAGQATKAVNQIMAAGINQAVTEALAFAEAMDLDLHRVIEVVSAGAAGNWFLEHRGPSMIEGRFDPGFRLLLHQKDLRICQAMAAAKRTRLPLLEMTLMHYQRLVDAGHGDEDISALFRAKQALFAATDPSSEA